MGIPSYEATTEQLKEKLINGLCQGTIVPSTDLMYCKSLPKANSTKSTKVRKKKSAKSPGQALVQNLQIKINVPGGLDPRVGGKQYCVELGRLAEYLLGNLPAFIGQPRIRKALNDRGVRHVELIVRRTQSRGRWSKESVTVDL